LTLTFFVGVFQLLLGILRLGTLVNFVSHTVVIGFTSGAAVLIAASQVKNFFGLPIPRGASVAAVLEGLFAHLTAVQPWIFLVAMVTLLVCALSKYLWPRLPHMIVGMVAGSALAAAINAWLGPQATGLSSIGALTIGFPPLSSPDWSWDTAQRIAPIAAAVALLALTEAVSIARAMALSSGQRIDGNQEFIGQGLSNIIGAFFSGYASSGSFNRSGLNYVAGAQTPLAAVFSAGFLLLIMLFLAPLAQYLPTAAMAGILFVVAWGLIDFHHIGEILRVSRSESAVLAATWLATLTVQLEFAIYIGVALSLLLYLKRTSQPGVDDVKPVPGQMPPAFSASTGLPDCPQLKIVRINGSIFFGAVNHLQEAMQAIDAQNPAHVHVLLAASGINFVDLGGAQWLAQEAQRRRALGGSLYIFHMKDEPLAMLRKSGAYDAIGKENFFTLGDDLMPAIKVRLNPQRCAQCSVRVFAPCKLSESESG